MIGADLDAMPAEEALAFHAVGLVGEGELLPEQSALEAVMTDLEIRAGTAMLVPLADGPDKTVWVNITLPEGAPREIDAYAEAQGFTRSRFQLKVVRRVFEGS